MFLVPILRSAFSGNFSIILISAFSSSSVVVNAWLTLFYVFFFAFVLAQQLPSVKC